MIILKIFVIEWRIGIHQIPVMETTISEQANLLQEHRLVLLKKEIIPKDFKI